MEKRMKAVTLLHVLLALAVLGAVAPSARAQSNVFTTAWEQEFPHPINWYLRTSAGILIVRAGQTLTAIDGADGKQLWSLPHVGIGEGNLRGRNLLEVPDLSILLINRAKLPDQDQEHLLAVDLWTGKIEWQQPELDNFLQMVPVRDSDRVFLVTLKDEKKKTAAFLAEALVNPAIPLLAGPSPFRLEMTLLDPRTGHEDWTSEYPRAFLPWYQDARETSGQLYLAVYQVNGPAMFARVDLSNGKIAWEYDNRIHPRSIASPVPQFSNYDRSSSIDEAVNSGAPQSLQFAGGRVIFAAKDLVAFDPGSEKPVWTVTDLGKIHGLLVDQDLILGSGDDGAFAIGADNGVVRWKFKSRGHATNPLFDKEANALLFCDDKNFTELDAATGKVLRQTPHRLGSKPRFIRRVGSKFIIAAGGEKALLLNVATGESSAAFPKPDLEFQSVVYWVGWQNLVGLADPPPELESQLQDRWPIISAEAGHGQEAETWHARLQSFLTADSISLYAKKSADGSWSFRRVDSSTGEMQVFEPLGDHPDANPALGLIYFVEDQDRLRAIKIPAN
jgi:outer membrane protein assembly factor BamB